MAGVSLLVWAASTIDGLMRWVFGGLGIGLVVASFFHLNAASQPAPAAGAAIEEGVVEAQPWSKEAIAMARAQGKTVFVNFTAAWCVTCKLNEAVALNTPAVQDALSSSSIVYLKGDWTKRDADIAKELEAHQRAGVPLYLVYRPGEAAPQTLPQILNQDIVLKALDGGE
jgi:thiol:disulfide interchange protein